MGIRLRTTVEQQLAIQAAEMIFALVSALVLFPASFKILLANLVSTNPKTAPTYPFSNQKLPLECIGRLVIVYSSDLLG